MNEYLVFAGKHWPLVLALIVVIVLLIVDEIRRRVRGVNELTPAAAVAMLNRGTLVVDCRPAEDFRGGHIIGARNIPFGELAQRMDEIKRKQEKPVLAIGASPRESDRAAGALRRAGFKSVFVLKGGLATWRKENLPLEQAKQGKS